MANRTRLHGIKKGDNNILRKSTYFSYECYLTFSNIFFVQLLIDLVGNFFFYRSGVMLNAELRLAN